MPIQKEIYPAFDPFQLMMKGGATDENIAAFFAKNFKEKMDLRKLPWGYSVSIKLKEINIQALRLAMSSAVPKSLKSTKLA